MTNQTDTLIHTSSHTEKRFNPFPGLRPFSTEESHLFFGREGQSDEILEMLSNNRFCAVIGASGSGKSSLMYCGLIPILYGGFISQAGSRWRVITTRPGHEPINNLANSIVESNKENHDEKELFVNKTITSTVLRSSSRGLVEAIKQLHMENENVLILVDQFEELFRFKRSGISADAIDESEAFVKLLIQASKQAEVPIYIVLTMRSDFIGDCAQFPNLTKKINDSHYLIPQMTRADVQQAIMGPVAVGGGKISPHLVQELLNDIGDNQDQLPILQHALMRTWDAWTTDLNAGDEITIDHYESIGKMEKALSLHANEAYDELTEKEKEVCEHLFKSLTEKGSDNRGIRNPTSVKFIQDISSASFQEVENVVDAFRKQGRSFLTPSYQFVLDQNSIIDISHESLMRIWDRLKVWVEEEAEAVQVYLRIADAAANYQQGRASLWRPPDLQLAINWRDKKQPTLQWGERFDPAFERAMVFLDTSKREYELEEENKIKRQKAEVRRSRIVAIVLGTAAVIALFLTLFAFVAQQEAEKQKIEAQLQKAEAEKQSEIAEQQRLLALEKEREALLQKEEAEKQKEIALEKEQEALAQKEIAEQQTSIAEQKTFEALAAKKEADQQKLLAQQSAKEALEQKSIAEQANEKAKSLRMLSIAKAMAVKSVNLDRDIMQKGLVAFQAYQFNEEYGGRKQDGDVYAGLYYALKALNEEDYNSLDGHTDAVKSMVFAGKKLYSSGSDGKILAWDVSSSKSEPHLTNESNDINRVIAVSHDEKYLAKGTDKGAIQIYDISNNQLHKTFEGHKGGVWSVKFAPNGKELYSIGADSTLAKWQISSGEKEVIEKTTSRYRALDISAKGDKLAVGNEAGKVYLVNLSNKNKIELFSDKNPIYSVALQNNGKQIAVGDRAGNLIIIDVNTSKEIANLNAHSARINEIRYSPDGKMLATAGFDGNVLLYETANFNEEPIKMNDHSTWVLSIAFTPDSERLIAGCQDKLIRVWPTNAETMTQKLCDKLNRNLTQDEWNRFVAEDINYEKTCKKLPIGEGVKE
jgi:WD40 repeat protein